MTSGSTITQQLIKNFYFRFHKSIRRKLPEMAMALKAEKILTKDEILELYINIIYYGCAQYGLTDAANYYFSVKPEAMTVNQIFVMMLLISAPTARNPVLQPEVFEEYRRKILKNLADEAFFTPAEVAMITANVAPDFDPQLRKTGEIVGEYGKDIYVNERFGIESRFGIK